MVTPVLKKKPLGDVNSASIPTPAPRSIQRSTSNASQQHIPVKQKSFDINISKYLEYGVCVTHHTDFYYYYIFSFAFNFKQNMKATFRMVDF
jgi:hypothetical protein